MQPNQIPSHPGVAQPQAAQSPIAVHQGAPAGIPMHPGVVVQQIGANPPAAPAAPSGMQDFFSEVALGDDFGSNDPNPPATPPIVPTPPPSTDLVSVDDLLSGGQFPEDPTMVQQPQPQAQPAPQAPAPQAPPPPQASQPSPEDLQRAAIDYLRDNTYKFDDNTARQALTEPEVVLPQLAARLHVNLVQEFAQQIQKVVPMLVERETAQRLAAMEMKNDFFRRFPKLNRPEWEGVIADSVRLAAQMHQGQTKDVILREGAALAAYRIRSQAPRPQAPANAPRPFVPASPGSGGPAVPMNPSQQSNPWAELALDPDLFA